MVTPLRYNPTKKLNDLFINSLWQSVGHPDTRAYLNQEDVDEKLRIDEERLQDWRRKMAQIRGKH